MDEKNIPTDPLSKKGEPRYYLPAAPSVEKVANEAFTDFAMGRGEPLVGLQLVALFDAMPYGQRENTLRRLGYVPVMSFFDETSGIVIKGHRFYGFSDGGGLIGDSVGYETEAAALAAMAQVNDGHVTDISTKPEDLGSVWCSVLSGLAFVGQLQKVDHLTTYGRYV